MARPVLMAWSGGKDCTMALAELRADSSVHVVGLVTTVSPNFDRISIHGVRRSILHAQARSLDLPVFEAALAPQSSNDDYDRAWGAALALARDTVGDVRHVAYGDLFLADVRAYREAQGERHGYTGLFPLWERNTADLATQFIRDGYCAYLTCVDTTQLGAEFVGRLFDRTLLSALPDSVDPCGERGEFHSCVVRGPLFRDAITVDIGERILRDNRFAYCDLLLSEP